MQKLILRRIVVVALLVLGLPVPARGAVAEEHRAASGSAVALRDPAPYVHTFEQSTGGVLHVIQKRRGLMLRETPCFVDEPPPQARA